MTGSLHIFALCGYHARESSESLVTDLLPCLHMRTFALFWDEGGPHPCKGLCGCPVTPKNPLCFRVDDIFCSPAEG